MDAGSEVSKKIRSAIKAKLEELGAYVDEELPDYIMVMVANKKTRDQMIEDLRLFLNKNAAAFTNWLHDIIDRLHHISKVAPAPEEEETKKKAKDESESKKKEKDKDKDKKSKEKEKKSAKEKNRKKTPPPPEPKRQEEEDEQMEEEIALHPEIVGDELDQELASSVTKENEPSSRTGRKKIEAPRSSPPQNRNVGRVRPIRRRTPSPSPEDNRRVARSYVSSVVRQARHTSHSHQEEYDPLHPEMHQSTMSSVVKVSQRKYPVPAELQPKPGIFLRAMKDAHKETKDIKEKEKKKKRRKTSDNEEASEESSKKRKKRRKRSKSDEKTTLTVKTDARRVEIKQETAAEEASIEPDEMLFVDTPDAPTATSETKKTRFVVTMEGLSDTFRSKMDERQGPEEDEEMPEEPGPSPQEVKTPVKLEPTADDTTSVKTEPISEPGSKASSIGQAAPLGQLSMQGMSVNPLSIQLDEDDDEDSEEIDAVLAHNTNFVSGAVPVFGAGGPAMLSGAATKAMMGKVLDRCRFWPGCKVGDSCPFVHPTTNCKTFPQCTFGEKCLFIHPNCRFDQTCTRPKCPYTHASRKQPPSKVAIKQTAFHPLPVACKFGPKCQNIASCPFKHPKLCKYGSGCTNMKCSFSHPAKPKPKKPTSNKALVDMTKFKWENPKSTGKIETI